MVDKRVQNIIDWRGYLSTLDDKVFFELIRYYLGEIKTSYNKPSLIEDLSAFFRKEKNKESIVSLLSPIDLKILSCVHFIENTDMEKLKNFFSASIPAKNLRYHAENLFSRMLMYPFTNEDKTISFRLNPILEDCLTSVLAEEYLFTSYDRDEIIQKFNPIHKKSVLNLQHIVSLISYVYIHGGITKGNDSFKKKNAEELAELVGEIEPLECLYKGLKNIGIFKDIANGCEVDWDTIESFASLNKLSQLAYITASSCAHFTKSTLYNNAQLLIDIFNAMGNKAFTKESILHLGYMIQQNSGISSLKTSRFQSILSQSIKTTGAGVTPSITEAMIESAITMNYITECGVTAEGEALFTLCDDFYKAEDYSNNAITVDPGFRVMIMPGINLKEYSKLLKFLSITKCDTVMSFEISKDSVLKAYDMGYSNTWIKDVLSTHSSYQLPQNVEISIDEWWSAFNSAVVYKGYVLKVDEENISKVKRNPNFNHYVKEELAPGVYLLSFNADEDVEKALKKFGLTGAGKIKDLMSKKIDPASFFELRNRTPSFSLTQELSSDIDSKNKKYSIANKEEQCTFLSQLEDKVNKMSMSKEQREGLLNRIKSRIIVNEEQIRPDSVRFEQIEASGMDYQGKLHVIDSAISTNSFIHIENSSTGESYTGEPLSLAKGTGEALLTMILEDERKIAYSVEKLSLVKKVLRPLSF